MSQNNFRIDHIRVGDLPEFAENIIRISSPGQFVPISQQRAIAHASNPNAVKDDIGLLVAYDDDGEIVGYFGILPILLRNGEELHKVHWFSTWSVSSKVRGMGVGTMLMEEALTLNLDFLIVGSVHARRVCKKFGFWEKNPLIYYWIEMSGMGNINPLKWILRLIRKLFHIFKIDKIIKISTPATIWLDNLLSPLTKKLFYSLLSKSANKVLENFRFSEVSEIHRLESTNATKARVEMFRNIGTINWMLNYPWIKGFGQSATESMDYFFSDTRQLFKYLPIKVIDRKKDDITGFIVFSISRKSDIVVLKTLDYQFADSDHNQIIAGLSLYYGKLFNADIIEIPAAVSEFYKFNLVGRLLLQKKERIYQCHPVSDKSPLACAWNDIEFHLYDGDMPFS